MTSHTLPFTVAEWLRIDASLDNSAAVDRVDNAEDRAERAIVIREAGWAAAEQHPQAGEGGLGWPPSTATLRITLDGADWRFVLEQVERWGSWQDDDEPEARFERRVRALVDAL